MTFFQIEISKFVGQPTDISYTDALVQKTYYVNFGIGSSWYTANPFCQSLGGQLPMVDTLGKYTFLKNTFGQDYWLGLQAKVRYVTINIFLKII